MNRSELRRLSRLFRSEARILLNNGAYHGAYHLAGYSVECALKASIARRFRRSEFPDRDVVNKLYTHDLEKLLDLAGLRPELAQAACNEPRLRENWDIIKGWNEVTRYDPDASIQAARDMLDACTSRQDGILQWLSTHW